MALKRGGKRFYDWLCRKNAGDVVSRQEVLRAARWKESTLATYLGKGMLGSLVQTHDENNVRVAKNGNEVSPGSLERVFSQRRSPKR